MDEIIEKIFKLSKKENSNINERYIKLSEEFGEVARALIHINNTLGDVESINQRELEREEQMIMDIDYDNRMVNFNRKLSPTFTDNCMLQNEIRDKLGDGLRKEISDTIIRALVLYSSIAPGETLEYLKNDISYKTKKLEMNIEKYRL